MSLFCKKTEDTEPTLDLHVNTKTEYQYTIKIDAAFYQRTYTVIRSSDTKEESETDRKDVLKEIQDTIVSGCQTLKVGDDVFFLDKMLHIGVSEIKEVVKEIEVK